MLLLTSTSDLIRITTTNTTGTLNVHASYADYNGSTVTPGRTNTTITNNVTNSTIVGSPGASTQRNVKALTIYNAHATNSQTTTVNHFDNTTSQVLVVYTLLPGETLYYGEDGRFVVLDASGGLKTSPGTGRLLKVSTIAQGTTTFTVGTQTNSIRLHVVGAGGGGGGSTGNATQLAVGGGGTAGGYLNKYIGVTPNTAYSCVVGLGGVGNSNATGTAGTDSTFTVGGTTYTAKGGPGGIGGIAQGNLTVCSVAGGAGTAISTNGDVNGAGQAGFPGSRVGTTALIAAGSGASGAGGSGPYGAGGASTTIHATGVVAVGFGGGGGGSLSNAASALLGGAGTNGIIVVEEYA